MSHTLTLCAIPKPFDFVLEIPDSFWFILVVAAAVIFLIFVCTIVCIFQTVHRLIRPLRKLNEQMVEVMSAGGVDNGIHGSASSKELQSLSSAFHDLI